ncbi:polyprenol monophosphomannose synthase [Candidatus Woesearchaeota archaeon]|nr:polyprenol monophosphomannose synthase [Candidatus Woesearchaeota archaeon]
MARQSSKKKGEKRAEQIQSHTTESDIFPNSAQPISINKVSVVLPSYNEKENIVEAIERISAALKDDLHEIIIVDDNSPDLTWKIAQDLNDPKVRVIRRLHERGLASALDRGIREATGNVVVWMDCDLGLPPEDVPKLVSHLNEKNDIVVGSRYAKHGKDKRAQWRAAMSWIFNIYASCILGFYARDYTSGFIAVKRSVTDKVHFSPHGFGEYFAEFLYKAHKQGYNIIEIGYEYNYRKGGKSKLDTSVLHLFKAGAQYGWRILKIRFGSS